MYCSRYLIYVVLLRFVKPEFDPLENVLNFTSETTASRDAAKGLHTANNNLRIGVRTV
jgi:hypothetical protein